MRKLASWRSRTLVATVVVAAVVVPAVPGMAGPPERPVHAAGSRSAVRDSYIVVLKPEVASQARGVDATARGLVKTHAGHIKHEWDGLHAFSVTMTAADARRLAAEPDVAFVEQDQLVAVSHPRSKSVSAAKPTPNAVQNPAMSWALDRVDQHALPLDNSYAYDSTAGQGVKVFVLDTGIQLANPDFGGRAVFGADYINDGTPPGEDCIGGGTSIAGAIGGTVYGVAKKATLISVRIWGCDYIGSIEGILDGLAYVRTHASGPSVAMLDIDDFCVDTKTHQLVPCDPASRDAMIAAEESLIGSGISMVSNAGDHGADACLKSSGAAPGAFYVGATSATDTRAAFSNFGACLTMFAPGAGVPTDIPTGTRTVDSTAMSAALVTGTVALFLGKPEFAGKGPADIFKELVTNRSTHDKITGLDTTSPNLLLYTGPPGEFTVGDPLALGQHNDGRLELFAVTPGSPRAQVIHSVETTAGGPDWSTPTATVSEGWQSMAVEPKSTGAMQMAGVPEGGLLYARQESGANTFQYYNWKGLAAPTPSPVASVAMAHNLSNLQQVFVTNKAGEVWYRVEIAPGSNTWGSWKRLSVTSKIQKLAAANNADGSIGLLLIDDAGQVWYMPQPYPDQDLWTEPTKLGGTAMTSIAAALNSNGTIDVISVDPGGTVWRRTQNSTGSKSFSSPISLFPLTVGDLAAESTGGRVHVIAVDNLGKIYESVQTSANGGYGPWTQILGNYRARS